MSNRELPTDHLASTTKDGHRVYLYPADVSGWFRTFRNRLNVALILIFLTLPWIRIGGRPAILLDLVHRKFSILGVQFWAHDAPMLFLVIGGGVFTIAFVTTVWGRIWCGYACPQTVFVDGVYRKLERLIEGDSVARKRMDSGPWTAEKFRNKFFKWAAFGTVSLIIGHSFLAYFVGTEQLAQMVRMSPLEHPGAFGVMAFVSGLVAFDFGWFREQFCIVACPYGRFQSVAMDDRSMVVGYDVKRGEPRRGVATSSEKAGDCVNCYRCVAVCPTGIDIRRGTQLECIACTSCVDACDNVMEKLGRPKGLIRYRSLAGDMDTVTPFRPRSAIYAVLTLLFGAGLAWKVETHRDFTAEFVRAAEAPYQVLPGGNGGAVVTNHFKLDLRNQDFDPSLVHVSLDESSAKRGIEMVILHPEVALEGGELKRLDVFFRFPASVLERGTGAAKVRLLDTEVDGSLEEAETQELEAKLVGPIT